MELSNTALGYLEEAAICAILAPAGLHFLVFSPPPPPHLSLTLNPLLPQRTPSTSDLGDHLQR